MPLTNAKIFKPTSIKVSASYQQSLIICYLYICKLEWHFSKALPTLTAIIRLSSLIYCCLICHQPKLKRSLVAIVSWNLLKLSILCFLSAKELHFSVSLLFVVCCFFFSRQLSCQLAAQSEYKWIFDVKL